MTGAAFSVNGQQVAHTGEDRTHLADFLRDTQGLTGTHLGCEHGVCGACTLMIDGAPVRSCITYASACHGTMIRTIEDFDDDPLMAELRAAFQKHHGLQCGFCTPGMLATAYDIVLRLPDADEARIREELSGNLCRCTGYMGIVAAIRAVLETGPHAAPAAPVRPERIAAPRIEALSPVRRPGPTAAAMVPLPQNRPGPMAAASLEGGTTITRTVDLESPVAPVWAVLSNVSAVADCLPGASVDTIHDDGRVDGAFGLALGPIKALFHGVAHVAFDPASHSGTVTGSGGDTGSRSQAQGRIGFSLSEQPGGTTRLQIAMTYKLSGTLAQFGRPRIVEAVVDRLLTVFTRNLSARTQSTAGGHAPDVTPAQSVIGRLLNWLRGRLPQRRE